MTEEGRRATQFFFFLILFIKHAPLQNSNTTCWELRSLSHLIPQVVAEEDDRGSKWR